MLRSRPALTVALVWAAVFAASPAANALESPAAANTDPPAGTTWAVAPSSAEGPDGRVSFRHTIDPGAGVDEFVAVTNFSSAPAPFAVYASDGVVTEAGNFDLLPSGEQPVDSGAWVDIGAVDGSTARDGGGILIEVPASSTTVVPIRVDVPADATPGDHPAGVVAELATGDDGAVQVTSRVGVRLHLRVAGDVVASVVPESVSASYTPSWNPFAPGTLVVDYVISNSGNVRLGSTTNTQAAGLLGVGGASSSGEHREILPRQQTSASTTLAVWPLFFAWGEVTAVPSVVGDDAVQAALLPSTTSFTAWAIPWSQLVLLALLALVVVLVVRLRARAETRVQARIAAAVTAAAHEPTSSEGQPTENAAAR
ncbi:hypothetical protein ACFXQA_12995 [Microbacterium sp. P07]|uniref:hypothetical protein n=1 Tax=Microbacterium sp. P07 TaxID=3366952 RepID=UPI0037471F5E